MIAFIRVWDEADCCYVHINVDRIVSVKENSFETCLIEYQSGSDRAFVRTAKSAEKIMQEIENVQNG